MPMTSDQWYEFMRKKPYTEQENILHHWHETGQTPATLGEKMWYNDMTKGGGSKVTHKKHLRIKKVKKKGNGKSKMSGFLKGFGNWSQNVQNHFNQNYGQGGEFDPW